MRTFDFAPLFRSTVGFDRLATLLDTTGRLEEPAYPPYNIEKTGDDSYRITMAVAGFAPEEISVVAQANSLTVTGKSQRDESQVKYLHRGIAARAFERRFDLADYITVKGAELNNGLLAIELAREVPEAMKPRTIQIGGTPANQSVLQNKAA
jgi:molecular chaperone IbpA